MRPQRVLAIERRLGLGELRLAGGQRRSRRIDIGLLFLGRQLCQEVACLHPGADIDRDDRELPANPECLRSFGFCLDRPGEQQLLLMVDGGNGLDPDQWW